MTRLAERYGQHPQPITVAARAVRSLLAIALENAREGTVRELYGAAVAAWQAQRAHDVEVRQAFAEIAPEESAHAWLSFELDAWLCSRLSADERALVEAERTRAHSELLAELAAPVPEQLRVLAGLPTPEQACQLLESVRTSLSAAA